MMSMHFISARVVTEATTTASSIPTARSPSTDPWKEEYSAYLVSIDGELGYSTFGTDVSYGDISPGTNYPDYTWHVRPSGEITFYNSNFDGIYDSYGTNSPDTVWDDGAYLINPSGDVDVDYGNDYRNIVYDSYGCFCSPGTEHSSVDVLIVTIVGRVATSAYISWGEYNSYGVMMSPVTISRDNSYPALPSGVVDNSNDGVFDSYGIFVFALRPSIL